MLFSTSVLLKITIDVEKDNRQSLRQRLTEQTFLLADSGLQTNCKNACCYRDYIETPSQSFTSKPTPSVPVSRKRVISHES